MDNRKPIVIAADNSKETKSSIKFLAQALGAKEHSQMGQKLKNVALHADVSTFYFLAHGGRDAYAERSARDFVKAFNADFEAKFGLQAKQYVKKLCLVGCEIGLEAKNSPAFAQKIADEFRKQGYTQANVHAVSVRAEQDQSLYVELADSHLIRQLQKDGKGPLKVFLMPSSLATEYDKVRANKKKYREADAFRKQAKEIVTYVDLAKELAKPQHTFIPNETFADRQARIHRDWNEAVVQPQQEVIALLKARAKHTRDNGKKTTPKNLEALANLIEMKDPRDWQQVIAEQCEKFKPAIPGKKSTSYNMLKKLNDGEIEEAKKIAGANISGAPIKGKPKKPKDQQPPEVTEEQRLNAIKGTKFTEFKQRIDGLKKDLGDENTELSSCCFGLFNHWEMTTKQAKLDALDELSGANNMGELQMKAGNYLLEEGCQSGFLHWLAMIFGSWNNTHRINHGEASRTRTLLDDIQHFDAAGSSLRM